LKIGALEDLNLEPSTVGFERKLVFTSAY